jgi:hypothetical protein
MGACLLGTALAGPTRAAVPKAALSARDVIVRTADLPKSSRYEFDVWKEPSSPGGTMFGTPNEGGELDPPPENDPHVSFQVRVQAGVPYRCWLHMKVGSPKGKSEANLVYAQFTDATMNGRPAYRPRTDSYMTFRGPERPGWVWVGAGGVHPASSGPQIVFPNGGEVTVRLQAGMEGVGFDQLVLSPARFLDRAPVERVVGK